MLDGGEHIGGQHIATNDDEVARCVGNRWLLDKVANSHDAIGIDFADGINDSIRADFIAGHLLEAHHAATRRHAHVAHRAEQFAGAHQFVGQHDGEWFVANHVASAPNGVAKAERRLLVDEADTHIAPKCPHAFGHFGAATGDQLLDDLGGIGKVRLDGWLVAAVHDDDVLNASADGLIDNELQGRHIDDGQQLFGYCFGRWQETGTESGCWDDGRSHSHGG